MRKEGYIQYGKENFTQGYIFRDRNDHTALLDVEIISGVNSEK